MNKDLQSKLFINYPQLYRSADARQCISLFGIECGDGWYDLLNSLSEKIYPLLSGDMYVCQVKEKYGTLRYYMNASTDEIELLIREAEHRSAVTCEFCGKPGTLQGDHWVYTACEEHTKK